MRDLPIPYSQVSDASVPWSEVELEPEPIGQGTSGTVYRGTYGTLAVAVKVCYSRGRGAQGTVVEMLAECVIMQQLRHPHVLSTFGMAVDEHDEAGGMRKLGLVVELMSCSLQDILDDEAVELSWWHPLHRIALEVARTPPSPPASLPGLPFLTGAPCGGTHQVALGCTYLHRLGVLHRDLKPANVLLGHAPRWMAKVSDLGSARQACTSPARRPAQENT